ncbi:hypothetical protein [Streptomyces sp. NPDC001348]
MTAIQATADENFDEGCRTSRTARPVTVADAASALAPLDLAVLRKLPEDELEQQLEARWALYRHLDAASGGRHGPRRRDQTGEIEAALLDLIGSLVINVHEAEAGLAVRRREAPPAPLRTTRRQAARSADRS